MAVAVTRTARRIAEPGLLAAVAAVLHMTDLLLALGTFGSLLCPLPHAINCYRHGTRTGALGALSAAAALFGLGIPIEAAYHLLLFALPGLAAGWALRSDEPEAAVFLRGSLVSAAGLATSFLVLERLAGFPDLMAELRPSALTALALLASPLRGSDPVPAWLEHLPGLASPAVQAAWFEAVARLPWGVFLGFGLLTFVACWFAAGILLVKLRETPRLPRIPLAPRLPWMVGAGLVGLCSLPLAGEPMLACMQANAYVALGLVAYLVGYLHLLLWCRGNLLRLLVALAATLGFYYVPVWIGVLAALPGGLVPSSPSPAPGPMPMGTREGAAPG